MLYVGRDRRIQLPEGGYLYIHDEIPRLPKTKGFLPHRDSFNPLKDIDERKARDLTNVIYALYPQGDGTLTVRNGKREMPGSLLSSKRLDKVRGSDEVEAAIHDILFSPVVRKVFCATTGNFSFKEGSKILARINRAELGQFDSLCLGLFLIAHYPGVLVVPDFGFYAREMHMDLLLQGRLIAGVSHLGELPDNLREKFLLDGDIVASGVRHKDAIELAEARGLRPDPFREDNDYNKFIKEAMFGRVQYAD